MSRVFPVTPALNSLDLHHTQSPHLPAIGMERGGSYPGRGFGPGRQLDAFGVSIRGHGVGRGFGPLWTGLNRGVDSRHLCKGNGSQLLGERCLGAGPGVVNRTILFLVASGCVRWMFLFAAVRSRPIRPPLQSSRSPPIRGPAPASRVARFPVPRGRRSRTRTIRDESALLSAM